MSCNTCNWHKNTHASEKSGCENEKIRREICHTFSQNNVYINRRCLKKKKKCFTDIHDYDTSVKCQCRFNTMLYRNGYTAK